MAVTITSTPQKYTPSGNPLDFIFSSDETAQANFSFKVEVRVNTILVETHQVFVESGIKAHFNASDVAERYCNTPSISGTYVLDAANYIDLNITVIENYGTPPTDQASDNTTVVYHKGRLSKRNWLSYDSSDYIFAMDKKFLTTFPRTERRYINLDFPNPFMYLTNEVSLKWDVKLFDGTGLLESISKSTFSASANISILNITSSTLVTDFGFNPLNVAAATYISLQWFNNVGTTSETYVLFIDDRCYSSTSKHLVFLSSIGSLEPYTFIKRSVETANIKGSGFENQFGYFDGSGDYVYALGGVTDYVKEIENRIDVQTDWISQDEYQWLVQELLTSSLVYLYDNGNLIKVRVTTGSYELKTSENDMVFNLKVSIHIDNDNSTVV